MGCCCNTTKEGPKWKREVVQDHKFDSIDVTEFYNTSCMTHLGYTWLYVCLLKSIAVYIADLWTAISLLALGSQIYAKPVIPTETSKWIFSASILASYLILLWELIKTRRILQSRDIAYAFTSPMATCYYSIKSYKYYCLFRKIGQSRTRVEHVAFFVFFTLKGWKRLMIAEAPRQVINIVTLASALIPKWIRLSTSDMSDPLLFHITVNNRALGKTFTEQIMTGTMAFSVLVFAISFMLVCFAALLYFPLLCHIQGNLKEYCCHKVDKRIAGLLRKQAQKRTIKNEKRALHHHQHRPQPTLPQVDLNPYPTYNSSSDRACLMAYPQPPPVSYPSYSHHHW